jgi:hypothetical protein
MLVMVVVKAVEAVMAVEASEKPRVRAAVLADTVDAGDMPVLAFVLLVAAAVVAAVAVAAEDHNQALLLAVRAVV